MISENPELAGLHKDRPIRVGVADEHKVVREALRHLLLAHEDMLFVGEASTGFEALRLVDDTAMDVLILELAMPGQSGLDVLASLRARAPSLYLLVFSGYPEDRYARKAFKAGAHGFVSKACDPVELMAALRRIAAGNRYVSAPLALQLAREIGDRDVHPDQRLSKREFQVLLALAAGKKASAIGRQLNISAKTVTLYRARLLRKLGLKTNTDLTLFAFERNLLSDD
ncbi:response regulator transcription factor [Variovorax rhizosphaerae]|uniref:Response regulator transcription factor n=1 Tax=Variovorax rhizosphaerae TaxID=1836200 RepID=A0ABU8WZD9_9BURK